MTPHTSAPSYFEPNALRLRAANTVLGFVWKRNWTAIPSLAPDELIAKAAAKAGVPPDEDEVGWGDRLTMLCNDLEQHARLSNLGRAIAHGQLVAALSGRFRAHALWRKHPAILRKPLAAPIIIVGQMRSGSTRMQRLLACDPRLTFTRFFESWNPIPGDGSHDWRKWKGRVGLACAHLLNPQFAAIHPTAWHAPDEEIGLHNLSIYGTAFEAQWRVPGYTAMVEQSDSTEVYREFKRLLLTLAWLRDEPSRPWVLKVPQFTQDLVAILRVFPDARLIHLRRKTSDVVASSASMVCNQMRMQSDHVDPHWVGREWTRKVALREERCRAFRGVGSVPQVEVEYGAMTDDWEGGMRRVYRMLGLPLTEGVVRRMRQYLHVSDLARHTLHRYDPQRFGLAASFSSILALAP